MRETNKIRVCFEKQGWREVEKETVVRKGVASVLIHQKSSKTVLEGDEKQLQFRRNGGEMESERMENKRQERGDGCSVVISSKIKFGKTESSRRGWN